MDIQKWTLKKMDQHVLSKWPLRKSAQKGGMQQRYVEKNTMTSFNLFEIVFRPMVNKGMARGVSAILQRAPGLKDF